MGTAAHGLPQAPGSLFAWVDPSRSGHWEGSLLLHALPVLGKRKPRLQENDARFGEMGFVSVCFFTDL